MWAYHSACEIVGRRGDREGETAGRVREGWAYSLASRVMFYYYGIRLLRYSSCAFSPERVKSFIIIHILIQTIYFCNTLFVKPRFIENKIKNRSGGIQDWYLLLHIL